MSELENKKDQILSIVPHLTRIQVENVLLSFNGDVERSVDYILDSDIEPGSETILSSSSSSIHGNDNVREQSQRLEELQQYVNNNNNNNNYNYNNNENNDIMNLENNISIIHQNNNNTNYNNDKNDDMSNNNNNNLNNNRNLFEHIYHQQQEILDHGKQFFINMDTSSWNSEAHFIIDHYSNDDNDPSIMVHVPLDIISHILSFVDVVTLFLTCRQVSRGFFLASNQDQTLENSLYSIHDDEWWFLTHRFFDCFLSNKTHLIREINISGTNPAIPFELISHLIASTNQITAIKLPSEHSLSLETIAQHHSGLKSICMNMKQQEHNLKHLTRFPKLKKLTNVNLEGFGEFNVLAKIGSQLEELFVFVTHVEQTSYQPVFSLFRRFTSMRSLAFLEIRDDDYDNNNNNNNNIDNNNNEYNINDNNNNNNNSFELDSNLILSDDDKNMNPESFNSINSQGRLEIPSVKLLYTFWRPCTDYLYFPNLTELAVLVSSELDLQALTSWISVHQSTLESLAIFLNVDNDVDIGVVAPVLTRLKRFALIFTSDFPLSSEMLSEQLFSLLPSNSGPDVYLGFDEDHAPWVVDILKMGGNRIKGFLSKRDLGVYFEELFSGKFTNIERFFPNSLSFLMVDSLSYISDCRNQFEELQVVSSESDPILLTLAFAIRQQIRSLHIFFENSLRECHFADQMVIEVIQNVDQFSNENNNNENNNICIREHIQSMLHDTLNNSTLENLGLFSTEDNNLGIDTLQSIIHSTPSVDQLHVYGTIHPSELEMMSRLLPCIHTLSLSTSDKGLEPLIQVCGKYLSELRVLNLEVVTDNMAPSTLISSIAMEVPQLTELKIKMDEDAFVGDNISASFLKELSVIRSNLNIKIGKIESK